MTVAQIIFTALLAYSVHSPMEYGAEHIFPPENYHNHSSSIVETPQGDLIACWFHGHGERTDDNLVILGSRKKRGATTWSPPFLMADNQNLPDQNCTLFIDPDKRLWLFWTSALDNEVRSFFPMYRYSVDYEGNGAPTWTWQDALFCRPYDAENAFSELYETRLEQLQNDELLLGAEKEKALIQMAERRSMYKDKLFQRIGWLPRQPPIMLQDGRMMLGLYSDTFDCSMFAFTRDAGDTWEFSRPLMAWGIQPAPIQKTNGDILAYLRSSPKTGCVKSTDQGKSWETVPLEIPNAGSSIAVLKLKSGNWLMAVNDDPRGRHQLSLYLSTDEGESWERKRYLERIDPESGKATASYPTLIQASDGLIHCTFTHVNESKFTGKSIRHVWFTEKWVTSGKDELK
ncbi:MAG: exo-alpha-sialidase [Planctomycetaceae bacterium]|nr:exo-alpha-sialidase [Planctomycetaceae bacterium]